MNDLKEMTNDFKLSQAYEKIKELEIEVIRLQDLLNSNPVEIIPKNSALELIENQISLLNMANAGGKYITLEDTKILDLLLKNKKLLLEMSNDIPVKKNEVPKEISFDDLAKIAALPDESVS